MSQKILLPHSLYSPEAPFRLLYTQHWSQISKDALLQPKGTWCATYDNSVVIEWQQRKYCRTVPLDPGTNVTTFRSAPGYNRFKAFVSELNNPHGELFACDSRPVSDDKASDKETLPNERSLPWSDDVGQSPDKSSLDPASYQGHVPSLPEIGNSRLPRILTSMAMIMRGNRWWCKTRKIGYRAQNPCYYTGIIN